jgi:hypothetical protein
MKAAAVASERARTIERSILQHAETKILKIKSRATEVRSFLALLGFSILKGPGLTAQTTAHPP